MKYHQSKAQIRTSLPFCLYKVDGRFFKLPDGFNTKIRFNKIETTPNRRTEASQNMETVRDRWGIDAHSNVSISTDKELDSYEQALSFSIETVNNFIKLYRIFDKEAVHLTALIPEDLFGFHYESENAGTFVMGLSGGIRTANHLLTYETSNALEKFISEKQPYYLWQEFLDNSERYLYQGNYRHSVLESVIALEIALSGFINFACKQKGISDNEAKGFIQKVGLTGNIKVSLKLLVTQDMALPQASVLNECEKSIQTRNGIVHKGRNDISTSDAHDALENIRIMINFLTGIYCDPTGQPVF